MKSEAPGSHDAERRRRSSALDSDSRLWWASEELSSLDLRHKARNACAIRVLSNMARGVGSRVTDFAKTSAEQQQAYGFVENGVVDPGALTAAGAQAALRRVGQSDGYCIAPVDGTSLKLTDKSGKKQLGRLGTHDNTRGLIVQTAMAVSDDGLPLGILDQRIWARPLKKTPKTEAARRRKRQDKESRYWLETVQRAEAAALEAGMQGRMWFQLDRGYDSSLMLDWMATSPNRATIRGEYNRALWIGDDEDVPAQQAVAQHRYVKDAIEAAPVLSTMVLSVEAAQQRTDRLAQLQIKVAEVDVRLRDKSQRKNVRGADSKRRNVPVGWPRTLTVLCVREVGPPPANEAPLQWMLWVNAPIDSAQMAQTVVRMYSYRWRIEVFHRLWKSGAMKIEQTQARSVDNIQRIARMSALVACRLYRLTLLARHSPDDPASNELSATELAVLSHMDPRSPRQKPRTQNKGTIAWAIAVIADMGGYTGKSSGGPPGPFVIARGYQRMRDHTVGFEAAWKIRDQC